VRQIPGEPGSVQVASELDRAKSGDVRAPSNPQTASYFSATASIGTVQTGSAAALAELDRFGHALFGGCRDVNDPWR
jgi:hypothetical protein